MFRAVAFAVVMMMNVQSVRGVCPNGQVEMIVHGAEGLFCTPEPACSGSNPKGGCPPPQPGLSLGAFCDFSYALDEFACKAHTPESYSTFESLVTFEAGDTPPPFSATIVDESSASNDGSNGDSSSNGFSTPSNSPSASETPTQAPLGSPYIPSAGCSADESEMSVEGVNQVFCVRGTACSAAISDGICPEAQQGLPYGSYCGIVQTGVYGCKPYTDVTTIVPAMTPAITPSVCEGHPAGDTAVSVEGAGTFCASQPVCSGSIYGNCPGIQPGLPFTSRCAVIGTGVYGCTIMV